MFPLLLEKEPSEEDIPEEDEEEEEPEEVPPDEYTVFLNQEISECFDLFDVNQIGSFDIKYLEKALKCLGIFLTSVELEELTEVMNSEGVVLFPNFQAYTLEKMKESDPFDAITSAFRAFDPENEGMVPSDRLKRWMTTLGDPLTEKEAKELVKMGDPGNKGFVLYENLVGILMG